MAIITYFLKAVMGDVKETREGLAAHKLHVSETYAKDATTQASLARIHDRIDEVGGDIKDILKAVGKK